MNEQEVMQVLGSVGAVISDSHIVYTSGLHGKAYINKDAVYPHTAETSLLCRAIAERFVDDNVQVVIAPAIGGVILSQWTAHHLTEMNSQKVFGIYAEKEEQVVRKSTNDTMYTFGGIFIDRNESLLLKRNAFVIKRGYNKLIAGKNVLVVEDVLTTGDSAKQVIKATRTIGGNVIGLGVLCNRGRITPQDLANIPKLAALVNINLETYDETACPLCAKNVPINTDIGKGGEFLTRLG